MGIRPNVSKLERAMACLLMPSSLPRELAPKRCLVFAEMGIGNLLFLLPAIAALKEKYPHAELHAVVRPSAVELLGSQDLVEKLIVVPNGRFAKICSLLRILFSPKFDLSLSNFLSQGKYSRLALILSRARARIGHVSSKLWSSPHDYLFNIQKEFADSKHEVENNLALLPFRQGKKVPKPQWENLRLCVDASRSIR